METPRKIIRYLHLTKKKETHLEKGISILFSKNFLEIS